MLRNHCPWLATLVIALSMGTVSAELPQQLKVEDQLLQLNGAGGRSKAFIQIYESGLYLRAPSKDARTIINADELMAIRVKITSSFVSRSSLISSLRASLDESKGGDRAAIAKSTELFIKTLSDDVNKNDVYDFLHVPNKGLYIMKNGSLKGTIPGIAFKQALFGIWLSDKPVDDNLRQAMLSGSAVRK